MARMENFLSIARGVVSEDDLDIAEKLLSAENYPTKESLGDDLSEMVGYNPIEYHDRQALSDMYDEILDRAPQNVKDTLIAKREELIDRVFEHRKELDDEYLYQVLINTIMEATQWDPDTERSELSTAIADEILGIEYGSEEDEDETEDSEDSESDGSDEDDEEIE